jgi:hypothetical protein
VGECGAHHITLSHQLARPAIPILVHSPISPHCHHYDYTINATPYAAGPCTEAVSLVLNYIYFGSE